MEREAILADFSEEELEALEYDWRFWGRPNQFAPPGKWAGWLIRAGRGFGKALALDVDIPTPSGWKTMAELSIGDTVFDEKGNPCSVTFATDVMHGRPCYEVMFDDGTVIVADAEHQWETWTHSARKALGRRTRTADARAENVAWKRRHECEPGVVTTEQIRETLLYRGRERNHAVSLCKSLDLPDAELPIPPYLLGVWLGDGDSRDACITSADREVIEFLRQDGHVVSDGKADKRSKAIRYVIDAQPSRRDVRSGRMVANDSLCSKLRAIGVKSNKHIPQEYLRTSTAQRTKLLMGLMDTDGTVSSLGHCEFCSTSKKLAQDVKELALSLGFKVTLGTGSALIKGRDCGEKYRVTFTPHSPVFRLRRKLERQHAGKRQKQRTSFRYITEIRPTKSVPVKCIQVDSPSHLYLASRSFIPTHNTRAGAEWVRERVTGGARFISLIGATAADARDVMVEGESGLLSIFPPAQRPIYESSKRRITFHTGARATLFSADEPERLRGPQSDTIWSDEIGAWRYDESWHLAMMGLRLGDDPRWCATTTPRPTQLVRDLAKDPTVVITVGSTYDNKANLASQFLNTIITRFEGTRLGRQEISGELLLDVPGALWDWSMIERAQWKGEPPEMKRIVVAVDPAVTSGENSDDTGIVVAGLGKDGRGYILADLTCHESPLKWAEKVVNAFDFWHADKIIGEANNGGDLIEMNIRTVRRYAPFKKVHASRGKLVRAEPVASLYEQGRVSHCGVFKQLEEQMTGYVPDSGMPSPNNMDAAIWALTELMVNNKDVHVSVI